MACLSTQFLVACVVLVGAGACNRQEAPPADTLKCVDPAQLPDEPHVPEEIVVEAEPEWSAMERDLMFWLLYRVARGTTVTTDAHVRLEEESRIEIRQRGRWQAATLDGLAAYLERAKKRFAEKQRAQGKVGYDSSPLGGRASGLFVGLDLHPSSLWQHFRWVLTVFMEHRVYKLQVRVGDRMLHMFLPWDAAIEYTSPPPHIHAKVHIETTATVVGYRIEGEEIQDLVEVTATLEMATQRAVAMKKEDLLVGVPVAPPEMSVEHVLDLFLAFLDAGIPRLDFMLAVPRQADREVEVLRAPVRKRR